MASIIILYDSKCDFCTASVMALKKIDWLGQLELRDLHKKESYKGINIQKKEAEKIVHAISGGKATTGFFAFRTIAWRVPVFWLLAPILYLPGAAFVGKATYKWITEHRTMLYGKCSSGTCAIHKSSNER